MKTAEDLISFNKQLKAKLLTWAEAITAGCDCSLDIHTQRMTKSATTMASTLDALDHRYDDAMPSFTAQGLVEAPREAKQALYHLLTPEEEPTPDSPTEALMETLPSRRR